MHTHPLILQVDDAGNLTLGTGCRSCQKTRQAFGNYPPDLGIVMWNNVTSSAAATFQQLLAYFQAPSCELLQPIAEQLRSSAGSRSR